MNSNDKDKNQDTASERPMTLGYCAPEPIELRLAIEQQRLQSTQRHKDALEGLAIDHHRHIEQLTRQLFHERQSFEEQLSITMHERDAKTNRLLLIEDFLAAYAQDLEQLADPANWSGSICTANAAQERLSNLAKNIRGLSVAKNSVL